MADLQFAATIPHSRIRRITDPAKLAQALMMTPYVERGESWAGADCWGVALLWYANRHGIELADRGDIAPGPAGIEAGMAGAAERGWLTVSEPRADDLIVMASTVKRQRIEHGHCGVYHDGMVLHSEKGSGCKREPYSALARRVTAILRRAELA